MNRMDFDSMLMEMGYDVAETERRINRFDKSALTVMSTLIRLHLSERMEPVPFPKKVIILADRLYGTGLILQYYLMKYCGANVLCVASSNEETMRAARACAPDCLVLVGFQENARNYAAIGELRKAKHPPIVAMWGNLDGLILGICKQYHIERMADRQRPIQEIVYAMM